MAKARPGVILYFDIRPAMSRLTKEQKGDLLDAILDYGQVGVEPGFGSDPFLQMAWDFIRPRIDADGESYDKRAAEGKYGSYCKKAKKQGIEPLSFDIWNALDSETQRTLLS